MLLISCTISQTQNRHTHIHTDKFNITGSKNLCIVQSWNFTRMQAYSTVPCSGKPLQEHLKMFYYIVSVLLNTKLDNNVCLAACFRPQII